MSSLPPSLPIHRRPSLARAAIALTAMASLAGGVVASASPGNARVARHHRVTVGIGENQPYIFKDPRYLRLHLHYVRRTLPWDVFSSRSQSRALTAWLRWARQTATVPLITYSQSVRPGHHADLPTPRRLSHEFRIFRRRFPWVTDFATWNEANLCGPPTCHRVGLVVAWYRAMRRVCPRCHILATEVLDIPGMDSYVREFIRLNHGQPSYWGLHDYVGANRLSDASTRAMARIVSGQIWLTETGGLVSRRNFSRVTFPQNPRHAARVTAYLLDHMVQVSPKITRVYLYEWNAVSRYDSWDSALIGPNQKPRPSFYALVSALHRRGSALVG